jgi:hypothetical protein
MQCDPADRLTRDAATRSICSLFFVTNQNVGALLQLLVLPTGTCILPSLFPFRHLLIPIFFYSTMMRPSQQVPDEEDEDKIMNIELQATDSTGSSKDEESVYDVETTATKTTLDDPETAAPVMAKDFTSPPRRRTSLRQKIALFTGIVPVCVFALEMIPERCHVCIDGVELDAYFFTAAFCGGLGAVLYGDSLDYWMARVVGGSIGALGSLFTIWMLLQSIASNLAFLFVFVGILGAMPGFVAYFIVKILSDECYVSDLDDWEEIAPLTKLRLSSDD